MTAHRNRFLWIRPTDTLNSNFIGITTLHVSGSLSAYHQAYLAVHRLSYILCRFDDGLLPGAGWQCRPAPGSKRSSNLHKMYQSRCTAKNSWWWAERLPETCRVVIPIKLEFSVSVGLIHKETAVRLSNHLVGSSGSMQNHTCPQLRWIAVRGTTGCSPTYRAHTPQVQNYAAKHRLRTRKISQVISVKHVHHSLMMDRKRSETCRSDFCNCLLKLIQRRF